MHRDGSATRLNIRPICEAVELPAGVSVMADLVRHPDSAAESLPAAHFHGLCELVWFRQVDGDCFTESWQGPLSPGNAVFVPSMQRHDFHLAAGAKQWVLVQFDPYLLGRMADPALQEHLTQSLCVRPEPAQAARLEMLLDWLVDVCQAGHADLQAMRLLELALSLVAASPRDTRSVVSADAEKLDRLRGAFDLIHRDPGAAVTLASAAALCNLSPAYFSRRFKDLMGTNFNAYLRHYRLHLAAQRLLTTAAPVSRIAYELGFENAAYFSASFTRRFAMSPRDYRRTMQQRRQQAEPG